MRKTPEQKSADERRYAAFHEAGHAIIGCAFSTTLGDRLGFVSIGKAQTESDRPPLLDLPFLQNDSYKWAGIADFPHPNEDRSTADSAGTYTLMDIEPKDIVYAYCVQIAAGKYAEKIVHKKVDPADIANDEANLSDWAVTFDDHAPEKEINRLIYRARKQARILVKEHTPDIERVANTLLSTPYTTEQEIPFDKPVHYLSGDQVRQIIAEASS